MRRWWKAPMFSPRGFALRAAILTLCYAALHLAGLRVHAAFLSGTPVGGTLATLAGLVYVLAYFSFVIAVPILLIAAVVLAVISRGPARE